MADYTNFSGTVINNKGGVALWDNKRTGNSVLSSSHGRDFMTDEQLSGPRQETGAPGASGTVKALSAGNFAKTYARVYDIIGENTSLAGVASTVLDTPAGDRATAQAIDRSESNKTLKQVTAGWNYVTGRFLTTPTESNDSFGTDDASRPSRAIPGEFVIHQGFGAGAPTQKDYRAKTS